jgi:hypothetical protein
MFHLEPTNTALVRYDGVAMIRVRFCSYIWLGSGHDFQHLSYTTQPLIDTVTAALLNKAGDDILTGVPKYRHKHATVANETA